MREAAQLAGEALHALVARVARFNDLAFECHRAGFGASLPLITANLRRSVAWGMYPIGCGEIFPVSQRVELGALLTNYSARAEAEASRTGRECASTGDRIRSPRARAAAACRQSEDGGRRPRAPDAGGDRRANSRPDDGA